MLFEVVMSGYLKWWFLREKPKVDGRQRSHSPSITSLTKTISKNQQKSNPAYSAWRTGSLLFHCAASVLRWSSRWYLADWFLTSFFSCVSTGRWCWWGGDDDGDDVGGDGVTQSFPPPPLLISIITPPSHLSSGTSSSFFHTASDASSPLPAF